MEEINNQLQACIQVLDEKSKEISRHHDLLMLELNAAIEKAKLTGNKLRDILS